jgi:hypothetical protein
MGRDGDSRQAITESPYGTKTGGYRTATSGLPASMSGLPVCLHSVAIACSDWHHRRSRARAKIMNVAVAAGGGLLGRPMQPAARVRRGVAMHNKTRRG